jgi:hypothetical protein
LSGRTVTSMWRSGVETVSIARGARFPSRQQLQFSPYLYLGGVFCIFMWIWWGRPFPVSKEGYRYLFTAIDRSTRWLKALLVKDLEVATAADALVSGWVSRFGVPADITSDRGTQFCSQV